MADAQEGSPDERLRRLADESARIEESCMWSSQGQFEQAKRWRSVNLWLGVPASLLAALAGASALAATAGRIWAGIAALVAAGLSAIHTTINANQRMNQALSAANAYLEIQTAARQFRLIDLGTLEYEEARSTLQEITARRDEVNKTADAISRFAYRRAGKNIRSGGQSYSTDAQRRMSDGKDG